VPLGPTLSTLALEADLLSHSSWPSPDEFEDLDLQDIQDLQDAPGEQASQQASMTLARVLQLFGPAYRERYATTLTKQQDRVLRELTACYTPLMGTHEWTCHDCGTVVTVPNACNNRHCPCCGEAKRRKWAATTCAQLLPVPYYHVILTVPRPITLLALANPKVLYSIMLRAGAEALIRSGRKLFHVELALLSLLHSWGSLMNAHLHSHSMLPGGGLWTKGLKWIALSPEQIEDLLLLVSVEFPRRFLKALRKAHAEGLVTRVGDSGLEDLSPEALERWLASCETTRWVIRCPQVWDRRGVEDDEENAQKTLKYLANYANRVALSNDRVVAIEGDQVLLRYKDYKDGHGWKTRAIEGVEFIHRFMQHLLPPRLHHIRRYAWMARRVKNEKLQWLREQFHRQCLEALEPADGENRGEPLEETEKTRPCRYCPGKMYLTNRTQRPSVFDILRMPLRLFARVQPGPIVTLGPAIQAAAGTAAAGKGNAARAGPMLPATEGMAP